MTENAEKLDALFVNLILIFKNAAMQQMGKIINPLTGKVETNLDQARFSIDMIDMLKEKTRGNLATDIEKLVDSTLLELRMNYVEEVNAEAKAKEEGDKERKAGPEAREEAASQEEQVAGEAGPGGERAEETGARKRPPKAKKAKTRPKSRAEGRKRGKKA